jgi:hypothetical protein
MVVLATAGLVSAAPTQWPVSEGGSGHYYEFVPTGPFAPLSWDQARAAAGARSHAGLPGHLATVTSAQEQLFLVSLWRGSRTPPGYYFLGGSQAEGAAGLTEGWSWITGEPWEFTAWSVDPREPNDMSPGGEPQTVERGNEQHLAFGTFGSLNPLANWNDLNARSPTPVAAGYVVEFTVPEPSAASVIAGASMLLCLRRRRPAGVTAPPAR